MGLYGGGTDSDGGGADIGSRISASTRESDAGVRPHGRRRRKKGGEVEVRGIRRRQDRECRYRREIFRGVSRLLDACERT